MRFFLTMVLFKLFVLSHMMGARIAFGNIELKSTTQLDLTSLTSQYGLTFTGSSDKAGYATSLEGDVNQDGIPDLFIGAPSYSSNTGRAYLVYGKSSLSSASLGVMTSSTGIKITGESSSSYLGAAVSIHGDVNGDGYADMLIGAYGYSSNKGRAYLIFGSASLTDITLSSLTSAQGIKITGATTGAYTGYDVECTEVTGDTYADMIISAPYYSVGKIYLLYGSATLSDINLASLSTSSGIIISGNGAHAGMHLAAGGDLNLDGLNDLIIADPTYNTNVGRVYVIWGSASPTTVNLASLQTPGTGIFIDPGSQSTVTFGSAVASGYDLNGDGNTDFVIGSEGYSSQLGRVYVLWGGNVGMMNFYTGITASEGITIDGASASDRFGYSVSIGGDCNGDGFPDLVVGAIGYSGGAVNGAVYLIYGGSSLTTMSVSSLSSSVGMLLTSSTSTAMVGNSVSFGGDVNRDGLADFIVGTNNPNKAYLIFGSTAPSSSPTAAPADTVPPSSIPTLSPTNSPVTPVSTPFPSVVPTFSPTNSPITSPQTVFPTVAPSIVPSLAPVITTEFPTLSPQTSAPSQPSAQPSVVPSFRTNHPTFGPSSNPTESPTLAPSQPIAATSSSSSSSNSLIVAAAGGGGGAFLIVLLFLFMWFRRRSSSKIAYEIGDKFDNGMNENNGGNGGVSKDVTDGLPCMSWNDIELDPNFTSKFAILGRGSFGTVIRVRFKASKEVIAVKIVTRAQVFHQNKDWDTERARFVEEAKLMQKIDQNITALTSSNVSHIIKFIALIQGQIIDPFVCNTFQIRPGGEGFGIIMRYMNGGTLTQLLYPPKDRIPIPLKMNLKMKICAQIAEGLAQLHSINVIHGDMKPDNILLDYPNNTPDEQFILYLSDFGLSILDHSNNENEVGSSTLRMTHSSNKVGFTPLYTAPELFEDYGEEGTFVLPSRSSDLYSLGIIFYEVIGQCIPFTTKNFQELKTFIKSGKRPALDQLPPDTPESLIDLIEDLWNQDRKKRPNAFECYAILNHSLLALDCKNFDIFFSHAWANKFFLCHVYNFISFSGYKVWYDQNEMGYDLDSSMQNGIANSRIFLVCLDQVYQSRKNCLKELTWAVEMKKEIVVLVLEKDIWSWISPEVKSLCNLDHMFVDVSHLFSHDWQDENEIFTNITHLRQELSKLIRLFNELHCYPSLFSSTNVSRTKTTKSTSGGSGGTQQHGSTKKTKDADNF